MKLSKHTVGGAAKHEAQPGSQAGLRKSAQPLTFTLDAKAMRKLSIAVGITLLMAASATAGALLYRSFYNVNSVSNYASGIVVDINQHVMLLERLRAHEYTEAETFLKGAIATDIESANSFLDAPLRPELKENLRSRITVAKGVLEKSSRDISLSPSSNQGDGASNPALKRDAPSARPLATR